MKYRAKNKNGFTHTPRRDKPLMRGFTLIELMVVIAIMGLLASVVLLRYPFTVKKVEDSRVISNLSQFRTQAAILYTAGGERYDGVASCSVAAGQCQCSDPDLDLLCKDAQKYSDQDIIIFVNQNRKGYCLFAHLADYDDYFCIDGEDHIRRYVVSPAVCAAPCQAANSCACE